MCSEALISECSSLHSCALMQEPVLFTEVHTYVQVHASMSGEVAHWYHAGLKTRQGLAGMSSNTTWVN